MNSDDTLTITDPDTPLSIRRHVVPSNDAKKIWRGLKLLVEQGVAPLMVCGPCQAAGRPEVARFVTEDASGHYTILCSCTARILEGVTKP